MILFLLLLSMESAFADMAAIHPTTESKISMRYPAKVPHWIVIATKTEKVTIECEEFYPDPPPLGTCQKVGHIKREKWHL